MPLDEPDVVEHRADVEQFGVVLEPEAPALQGAEDEHSQGVVVKQVGFDVADELGRVLGQRTVWNRDPGDRRA